MRALRVTPVGRSDGARLCSDPHRSERRWRFLPPEAELAARFAAAPKGLPLSGVPFFVKDLFDVAGEPTRAGATFLTEVRPAPARDSAIVGALRAAGAVLVGQDPPARIRLRADRRKPALRRLRASALPRAHHWRLEQRIGGDGRGRRRAARHRNRHGRLRPGAGGFLRIIWFPDDAGSSVDRRCLSSGAEL